MLIILEVLVCNLFGVKSWSCFFFSLSGGFNFTLSAIFSCDENCIDQGDDDDPGLHFRFVGVFCLSLSI